MFLKFHNLFIVLFNTKQGDKSIGPSQPVHQSRKCSLSLKHSCTFYWEWRGYPSCRNKAMSLSLVLMYLGRETVLQQIEQTVKCDAAQYTKHVDFRTVMNIIFNRVWILRASKTLPLSLTWKLHSSLNMIHWTKPLSSSCQKNYWH